MRFLLISLDYNIAYTNSPQSMVQHVIVNTANDHFSRLPFFANVLLSMDRCVDIVRKEFIKKLHRVIESGRMYRCYTHFSVPGKLFSE